MSDLGYQNKAQSGLKPCYNDLNTFLQRIYEAVTTPWPAYEKIGTHRNGEWIQLNTSTLQIENEFYSSIRPKRATGPCERPITALTERGVQYIEVRCLDIDPTEPTGISAQTARFVDAFLLFCALEDSPDFPESGFCPESAANFSLVVKQGRMPGLMLQHQGQHISLSDWANKLLDRIALCSEVFGSNLNDKGYVQSIEVQREKVRDPGLTPSAIVLHTLESRSISFHQYALEISERHTKDLRQTGLSQAETDAALAQREQSIEDQARLESSDTESFDAYVERYHKALKAPESSGL
jgi:glutamate--cysteine ligase